MYQVIARKHRPQTFDEVVGQAHVKQTFRNALDQRRIAHGYIFSGPPGHGQDDHGPDRRDGPQL